MPVKNKNVKKAHTEMEYTPEQIKELYKCKQNPIYFIEKYVKVQHPVKGSVPLILHPFQKKLIQAYVTNRYNIVLASRQVGKCCLGTTKINIVNTNNINFFKRIILRVLDKELYYKVFQKTDAKH